MTYPTLSIHISETETFSGYIAPSSTGKSTGIVLVQEIFGINKGIREAADRFAQAGYTVLAPDLFWRFAPHIELTDQGTDLDVAFDYYHRFDIEKGVSDIAHAVDTLRQHPLCNGKVVVLGFCLGGKLSYLTAAAHSIEGAVAFYGGGIAEHLDVAHNIHCPLLMHFGAADEMITEEQTDAIAAAFAGRPEVEMEIYKGVGHAFYNHTRANYNAAAATLAHEKTIAFLKRI